MHLLYCFPPQAWSSACLATEACKSFQFGSTTDEGVACAWFTSTVVNTQLVPALNFSVYTKDMGKV